MLIQSAYPIYIESTHLGLVMANENIMIQFSIKNNIKLIQ